MPTNSFYIGLLRLREAVHLCEACPLGTQGPGVPGMFIGETPSQGQHSASECRCVGISSMQGCPVHDVRGNVMVLGEAPGVVEQAQGQPFVGRSGELLHSMLKEAGLHSYYVSNIAKHQPFRDRSGKQTEPDKVAIEACAPFLRAEFELVRPAKLILLGKTAAKLVVDGNFSMGKVVNQTFKYGPCDHDHLCPIHDTGVCPVNQLPTLILYHPAYFLRQRTAPWIQKQIAEWKRSVRMFMGDRPPEYQIEKVECQYHPEEKR